MARTNAQLRSLRNALSLWYDRSMSDTDDVGHQMNRGMQLDPALDIDSNKVVEKIRELRDQEFEKKADEVERDD